MYYFLCRDRQRLHAAMVLGYITAFCLQKTKAILAPKSCLQIFLALLQPRQTVTRRQTTTQINLNLLTARLQREHREHANSSQKGPKQVVDSNPGPSHYEAMVLTITPLCLT